MLSGSLRFSTREGARDCWLHMAVHIGYTEATMGSTRAHR